MDVWKNFVAHGARTAFETQSVDSRSDCHGWSACPLYFLATAFAGVRPAETFFRSVRIAPNPGPLGRIVAKVPSPKGTVEVDLTFADGGSYGNVVLPEGLFGTYEFRGVSRNYGQGLL